MLKDAAQVGARHSGLDAGIHESMDGKPASWHPLYGEIAIHGAWIPCSHTELQGYLGKLLLTTGNKFYPSLTTPAEERTSTLVPEETNCRNFSDADEAL